MTRRREILHIHQLKRTYDKATSTFTYNITYQTTPTTQTQRTQTVAEAFGLGNDQTQTFTLYDNTQIKIKPTDLVPSLATAEAENQPCSKPSAKT